MNKVKWQAESSSPNAILVVKRRGILQQDLYRENGRIVWFRSVEEAQEKANELNSLEDKNG